MEAFEQRGARTIECMEVLLNEEDEEPDAFVRQFFEQKVGHPLIAWAQYFDRDNDRKVCLDEFVFGMQKMGYEGDPEALFHKLDDDGSGFLTISEVSPSSSDLWASFQHWAGKTFFSEEDMIEKLSGRKYLEKRKNSKLTEDKGMTRRQFYRFASSLGWYGGFEQILFMAMDIDRKGIVYAVNLGWFEEERTRQIKKTKYKTRGKEGGLTAMRKRLHALRSLQAFTQWLRYMFGPLLFHPWRRGIDKDGSMEVTRLELSTFCKNAGWRGDTNALWHALDNDDSGVTSLEEFAGKEARELALFKKWVDDEFGGVRKAWNAWISKCRKKGQAAKYFDKVDFSFVVESLGYPHSTNEVFDILHWEANGESFLTYKELRFLDSWQPVEWLSATPNPQAAEEFKIALFNKWKQPLKAWRALDEDGAGKVNFTEFSVVAARISFKGDIKGAWMALDSDASGYIALTEIDPRSARMLSEFRRWANLFFGSVMDAFRALDSDGGGSLSRAEFKKSVTKYSFRGDREGLFTLFDVACDGEISVEEMAFLDEWEISEVNDEPIPSFQEVEELLRKHRLDEDEDISNEIAEMPEFIMHCEQGLPEFINRRKVALLEEEELPMSPEELARLHKPMPGNELMELLGEVSSRPKTGTIASIKEGCLTSTGNRSPRAVSPLCGFDSQRFRCKKPRTPAPYIGGRAFMSRSVRAPLGTSTRRSIISQPRPSRYFPLPALAQALPSVNRPTGEA